MATYDLTYSVQECAVKTLIYGPEGIGKSSLAATWPSPVFIDIEGGTNQLPVARFPKPTSWAMLMDEIKTVRDGDIPCSTLVVDTLDAAERLCIAHITKRDGKDSLEAYGYGKGYTILQEEFGKFLDMLSEVVEAGYNVITVGHSDLRKFERPDESGAYDRFELKLTRKVAPMCKEWADMVLFCDYKTYVETDQSGKAKARGGKRIIRTSHSVTWDAKNRFGLPEELPLDLGNIPEELEAVIPDMKSTYDKPEKPAPKKPTATSTKTKTAAIKPVKAVSEPKEDVEEVEVDGAEDSAYERPHYPARLKKLADMMAAYKITDAELRHAVGESGNYPEECAVEDYEEGFDEFLLESWERIVKRVNAWRIQLEAQKIPVPFAE